MATITTRAAKGSALTHNEVDDNFANLNSAKLEFGQVQSAGTANGVPYLNASKLVTSGAVLTFDGTILSSTRFAGALNGTVGATTASTGAFTTLTTSSTVTITGGTANGVTYLNGSKVLTSGSALTFDGTNLATTGSLGVGAAADATHRAYIFASGNGIARLGNSTTDVNMTGVSGVFGINVAQFGGQLAWSLVGSEQMRLTSTGLGIGTSSPGAILDIRKAGSGTTGPVLSLINSAAAAVGNAVDINMAGNPGGGALAPTGRIRLEETANSYSNLQFWTYGASGFSERMRLDANGNFGIGTTSPGVKLDVRGTSNTAASTIQIVGNTVSSLLLGQNADGGVIRGQGGNNALTFWTGGSGDTGAGQSGSEKMRLDASGNLLVGTTNAAGSAALEVKRDTGNIAYFYNNAFTGLYLAAGGTSWTTTSDERFKTALIPFENAASKVCTLRAGTGRYLTDKESVSRSFLIAQDVQKVLPEAVSVKDDETGTLGVAYTDVIPLLVAAIKEQQAMIEELKTRLAAAGI